MALEYISLRAGPVARAHLKQNGLTVADVRCIPAAAGGPKGLALLPFDRWLFGDFLRDAASPPLLIGASIGAWRMAAGAQRDPLDALDRLQAAYVGQRYSNRPTPAEVANSVARLAASVCPTWDPRPEVPLRILVSQAGRRLRGRNDRMAFFRAAAANMRDRDRLAVYLKRLVFSYGPRGMDYALDAIWPDFDAFGAEFHDLTAENALAAMTASGSIPIVCDPTREIPGLPPSDYWDGGLIDYHLHLPYHTLPGITLYPHFATHIAPGWLDKHLFWRRAHGTWLKTVLLVAPSKTLLARLPNGKLPDRNDFLHYRGRDEDRIRDWNTAIAECQRMVDEFARWVAAPDLSVLGGIK